jgi:hypothetical protein
VATATAGEGPTIGVWGETRHGFGYGVLGVATASSPSESYGVYGDNAGIGSGFGVYGRGRVGVQGSTNNLASDFGLYSLGDAHVAGTFTATTKSFQIDHPLDPANKYPACASRHPRR